MRYWIVSIAVLLGFGIACDEINAPYSVPLEGGADTTEAVVQRVLIEDYTGFLCGNCVEASEIAQALKDQYPDRVVVMAIHAGFFATPTPDHPEDYRTPTGEEWFKFFGIDKLGNPNGMVNRREFQGKRVLGPSEWAAAALQVMQQQPVVDLRLKTQYDEATREAKIFVEAKYLEAQAADNYLGVYVIEDSVVGFQLDYRRNPPEIEDYVHQHMLRKAVVGPWGIPVSSGPIAAGSRFRDTLRVTLDTAWRAEHCSVVAFIHRYPTTYEILQVAEAKIVE